MSKPRAGDAFLGRLVNNDITAVHDLTEAEVLRISEAGSVLRSFHRGSQSYEHVRRDYDDLLEYVNGVKQLLSDHGTSPDLSLDVEVETNRRVMALLNSFKAFLDHSRHALSQRFGERSRDLEAFDRGCAAEYDGHFAYRLASRLRNYAQHRDLPIGYMTLSPPSKYRGTAADLSLMCVRDQLLASGFEWKSFTTELQRQPDSWNLQSTIEELMPCLTRLRELAVRPVLSNVLSAARFISATAKEVGALDAQPVIVRIVDPSPGGTRLTVTLFAHHHADQILDEWSNRGCNGHAEHDIQRSADKGNVPT